MRSLTEARLSVPVIKVLIKALRHPPIACVRLPVSRSNTRQHISLWLTAFYYFRRSAAAPFCCAKGQDLSMVCPYVMLPIAEPRRYYLARRPSGHSRRTMAVPQIQGRHAEKVRKTHIMCVYTSSVGLRWILFQDTTSMCWPHILPTDASMDRVSPSLKYLPNSFVLDASMDHGWQLLRSHA